MSYFETYTQANAVMMHEFSKGNKGSVFHTEQGWAYKPAKFQAAIAKPLATLSGNWDYTAIK